MDGDGRMPFATQSSVLRGLQVYCKRPPTTSLLMVCCSKEYLSQVHRYDMRISRQYREFDPQPSPHIPLLLSCVNDGTGGFGDFAKRQPQKLLISVSTQVGDFVSMFINSVRNTTRRKWRISTATATARCCR